MDRMRTMLFCPASQPKMFLNAPVFHPDAILFDLEDAVAYAEKDSARDLLCEAMAQLDFGTCGYSSASIPSTRLLERRMCGR